MTAPTKASATHALLRTGLTPRGLSREQAAAYIGVSPTMFDTMVADGWMPKAKAIGRRVVWDVRGLDDAFNLLPDAGGSAAAPVDNGHVSAGDVWDKART